MKPIVLCLSFGVWCAATASGKELKLEHGRVELPKGCERGKGRGIDSIAGEIFCAQKTFSVLYQMGWTLSDCARQVEERSSASRGFMLSSNRSPLRGFSVCAEPGQRGDRVTVQTIAEAVGYVTFSAEVSSADQLVTLLSLGLSYRER